MHSVSAAEFFNFNFVGIGICPAKIYLEKKFLCAKLRGKLTISSPFGGRVGGALAAACTFRNDRKIIERKNL